MTPLRHLEEGRMKIKIRVSQRKSVRGPFPEPCPTMIW